MELRQEPSRGHGVDGTDETETKASDSAGSDGAPSLLRRPPFLHKAYARTESAREPKTPAYRGKALSIDVNVPENLPPMAMASPLALFSTKKLSTSALPPQVTGESVTDHQTSPLLSGSPFLEYGMVVSLVCDDRNGIICAEGFASREVRLERLNYSNASANGDAASVITSSAPKLGLDGREERRVIEENGVRLLESPFRDCLFEVVPKMTYDATAALEELAAGQSRDRRKSHRASHSLADLKFKSDAEIRLNDMMYRKLRSTQVMYGQTVQFRHVKTGHFLCIDAAPLPLRGGEYSQVALEKGTSRAHFTILPRFKLRSKGAPVHLTDQLLLNNGSEEQVSSLYASSRQTSDGSSCHVVGSSVHSSQWRAVLFDRLDDGLDEAAFGTDSTIRAGSCIRLLHLESTSLLHYGPHPLQESCTVSLQFREDAPDEDTSEHQSETACLSSDSLWMVERAAVYEGGQIKWKDSICLRHVLTGKYLGVQHMASSPSSNSRSPSSRRPTTLTERLVTAIENPDVFVLIPTAATNHDDRVGADAITLLHHCRSKTFVHSPETHASSITDIRISSKALRHGEKNGSTFSVTALPGARDEDAFQIIPVPQLEVDDTLLLFSYKRILRQFVDQFEDIRRDGKPIAVTGGFDRADALAPILQAEEAVNDLLKFCSEGMKRSQRLHRLRQSMFRSHQFVDLLMDMIKAPFDRFGGPFSIDLVSSYNPAFKKQSRNVDDPDADLLDDELNGIAGVGHPKHGDIERSKLHSESSTFDVASSYRSETQGQVMRALNRIIPAANALLVQIFCGHRANEVYVAQRAMPILMELLGNGFQTSLPLSYLLRENRNLVESITAYGSIIRNFFELIKTRGRSIRYMQFLVALCTSRGRGVPKTQESICELMFNPTNGFRDFVIVPMRANAEGFEVFVGSRRTKKTPAGDWISLAALYQDYYVRGKHRGLGQYCYGLLQLYVALCLDRNYVSIDYVQQTFPRESLFKAVKDVTLSRSLRAVLLDLIRVAYVDCEPQKVVGCPSYTRIWTEVGEKGQDVKLPSFSPDGYSSADLTFFSQMKDMCSSYFVNLQGRIVIEATPENQLLLAMLKVCKKMVEFGMYASHAELSVLVGGLVDLLDERTDVLADVMPSANVLGHAPRVRGHHTRRWFGERKHDLAEGNSSPGRGRELSVTDDIHNLFSTIMVNDSSSGDDAGNHQHAGNSDAPLLLRLRNSALLDSALLSSSGDGSDRARAIARQYGVGSLIWNEHCTTTRSATVLHHPTSSDATFRQHPSVQHAKLMQNGAKTTKRSTAAISRHADPEVRYDRDRGSDMNRTVMEIKDEICGILQHVDSIRLDYQISLFLAAFRSHHGDAEAVDLLGQGGATSFDEDGAQEDEGLIDRQGGGGAKVDGVRRRHSGGILFTEKASPVARFLFDKRTMDCKFSLSQLSKRNVNTVFMQMLMYEYPPLVSKSLELLLQQFNQHDQLLSSLQNLQLLVAEETIEIYNRLKDDVNDLRRLSETTEVWMDLTSKSDFENAEWACSLLRTIRFVITKHTTHSAGLENGSIKSPQAPAHSASSKHGSAAHFQRRESSRMFLKIDDTGGKTDVVAPSVELLGYAPHLLAEKSPPNRKKRQAANVYVLNCLLGKVSHRSSCHELLPMAKSHTAELYPQRKVRSNSVAVSMVSEARRLLRNLRAAQHVVSMMEDGAHFYEAHTQQTDHGDESASSPQSKSNRMLRNRQHDQMRAVFEEALQFLCAFCTGDAENQSLLEPHAAMIVQYVHDLEVAQHVLVSIYTANLQLCKTVPTEVVNGFVTRLIEDPTNPRYLYFLETIVLCDEIPVHENQLLVLFQLIKSLESGAILQYFNDPDQSVDLFAQLFRRHAHALKGKPVLSAAPENEAVDGEDGKLELHSSSRRRGDTVSEIAIDSKLLEYHVRLLHLFAACATGKNTRCQEICQQIIPLRVVLKLLALEECSDGVQFALLRFLHEVFFTAEDVEIRHDDDLHHVFAQLCLLCETSVIKLLKELHDEDVNRHASAGLQKSKRFRDTVFAGAETKGKEPLESKELYLVLYGAIPTIAGFMRQFPQFASAPNAYSGVRQDADVDGLGTLADTLSALFAVVALADWNPPDHVVVAMDELSSHLDKASGSRQSVAWSTLWLSTLSQSNRPDLSRVAVTGSIHEVASALRTIVDGSSEPSTPAKNANQGGHNDPSSTTPAATVSKHGTQRTRRLQSKPESSVASDHGVHQHFSDSHISTHTQLDRLHVVQPMISGARVQGDPAAPGLTGDKSKGRARNERLGRRDSCSKAKGLLGLPLQSTSSKPSLSQSLMRRMGFQVESTPRRSIYSRHSTLSIQCSSTGKVNSSLFKSYQKQAAVRQQRGIVSRHQRFEAFDQFLWRLCSDVRVENAMREELNHMVDSILSVEASLQDEFDAKLHSSDVRLTFNQVVTKLVAHVQAFKDAHYVKTNLILLDVFCRMIYATDGDWERRHAMQIKLNQLKVTKLVVHLIATREDDAIFERSVELGVALLDGMNAEVQESFHKYWLELPNGSAFFTKIQGRIEKACRVIHNSYGDRSANPGGGAASVPPTAGAKARHPPKVADKQIARLVKRRSVMYMETADATPLVLPSATASHADERNPASLKVMGGPMTLIFRFLQLLCEGHYLNAQRFFIAQPNAPQSSVNLVEATTSFLLDTYLALANLDVGLIIQLFETITEFCQGPCIEAQETVANFKFFSTVNALLMHEFLDQNDAVGLFLVRRLRASVVITLLSLLEGRSDAVIHTQLVQELNFEALKRNLVDVYGHFLTEYEGVYAGNVKCSDDFYLEMGFNIYFLLQKLTDSFPASSPSWIPRAYAANQRREWTEGSDFTDPHRVYYDAFAFFQSNSARVEIVWNHQRDARTVSALPVASAAATKQPRPHGTASASSGDPDDDEGSLIAYYFPLHPMCYCLTEQSKKKLVWHVSRGASKLHDFYARSDKLVDEMAHQSRLQHHRTLAAFARSADVLKRVSFILAVAINLLVLIYYQADGIESMPYAASHVTFLVDLDDIDREQASTARIGLSIAGTIQLELCVLILLCYLVNSAPLLIKKGWKRRIRSQQDLLSKKKASIHRRATDADDRESFQDTEQLLRSLREREEEYNYLFLPHRQYARSRAASIADNANGLHKRSTSHEPSSVAAAHHSGSSSRNASSANAWERLWRFLFGPTSVLFRNAAYGRDGGATHTSGIAATSSSGSSPSGVTTLQYLETVAISLYFLARSPRVLYYMWQICIAILGSYVNNLFFAFHLLDVVNRYQELSNVLRSIVRPAKVLGVTLLLYLVVVYVFAIVGFYFFREDYNPSGPLTASQRAGTEPYQCQRLFQCFLISLDQGLKSDGGLGGYLKYRTIGASPSSYARMLFDVLYNTILLIMLLNIVFGVIIDTFASLREADHEKLMDMQNRCFICSIDAYTFDRATKRGFHDHIYSEHNMWHYLYLFVHIRKKPITEYNGLELYLAKRMAKKDVSFFPNRRALSLEKTSDGNLDHVVNNVALFQGSNHSHDDGDSSVSESVLSHHLDRDDKTLRGDPSYSTHSPARGHVRDPRTHATATRAASQRMGDRSERDSGRRASSRRVSVSGQCVSPSCTSGRSVSSKLDKLESTIQHLLSAQSDLKDQHTRSLERQNELLELLAAMHGSSRPASQSQSQSQPQPTPSQTHPHYPVHSQQPRRMAVGIVQRSPPSSMNTAPPSTSQPSGRRTSHQPRVFNFDSVVEDP